MSPERWQQITQLFDEAVGLGLQERAAFLAAACQGDGELRRQVEELLDAEKRLNENTHNKNFLADPALEVEAHKLAAAQVKLSAGQRVAHFEILQSLGEGAMGEVYLAQDLHLNRKMALKLLPFRFTLDSGRLRRFKFEARAASLLNHPNIVTVFDLGWESTPEDEWHYIAMEFVEGITLRERLAQGPLPLTEAISIARQIGSALAAAHAAGIVHRDIKPENVMLRPDGVVKVLDFGIAKLTGKESASLLSPNNTAHGTIIGTPGYMSPEQARGQEVDARTDIFSLGVVLYEMVTGQMPFQGETQTDTIAAILNREPRRLSSQNPNVSLDFEKLVATALAKERNARFRKATELLIELESCQPVESKLRIAWRKATQRLAKKLQIVTAHPAKTRSTSIRKSRYLLPTAYLLGGILLIVSGWSLSQYIKKHFEKPETWAERSQLHSARFLSKQTSTGSGFSRPAFSPDGKEVAYSLGEERGKTHLWVKSIASELETRITNGTALDLEPVWSPDGKKLAFLSYRAGQRDLWIIERTSVTVAEPALLKKLNFNNSKLLAWVMDRQREWIYLEAQDNLFAVDPVTAELRQLTQREKRERDAAFSLSPTRDRIVYLDKVENNYCLMLQSLRDEKPAGLLCDSAAKRHPIWFPDERKIAFLSNRTGTYQVYAFWLDDRRLEQITFGNESYDSLAVSPDGNCLLVKNNVDVGGVFAWDFEGQTETQYFSSRGSQVLSQVSPVGNRLIFQSVNADVDTIFSKPAVINEPPVRLTAGFRGRWSPDGKLLAFLRGAANASELWQINLQDQLETRLATGLLQSSYTSRPYNLDYAEYCWSPDSANLVYTSLQPDKVSNLWQVAVGNAQAARLTNNSDQLTLVYSPSWSPAGDQLVYLTRTRPAETQQPNRWQLHVLVGRDSYSLLEHDAPLRILGWVNASRDLLVTAASIPGTTPGNEIELLRITLNNRRTVRIGKVQTEYDNSLTLAGDGRKLALVARRNGRDNLNLVFLNKEGVKTLGNNSNAGTRYGSLSWTADSRHLVYSKQELWQEMLLITKKNGA